MTKRRKLQRSLWEGIIAEDVDELWEPWMREADRLLEDEELIDRVWEAQGQRHRHSRTRGRPQTEAEVALRFLLLKHVRNWSFDTLEREVRANLVYRSFTRIGMEKVPDAKTLARIAQALGPDVIRDLHERLVKIAQQRGVVRGRQLRVDTTVVETNIHYPTDSSLLDDGARVLTRTMQKIERKTGGLKRKVRNRMRGVTKRVISIGHALRQKGAEGEEKRQQEYRQLLRLTRQVLNDTGRVLEEVEELPRRRRNRVKGLCDKLRAIAEPVRGVVKQTRARLFQGVTQFPGKILSLFEPHTEIIRKGKAGKPNEFGKLLQVQEAENQIITHYEVFAERPSDRHLLVPAVKAHRDKLGRVPRLVAADAGFYSQQNERAVQEMGVPYVCVPNRSTRCAERRQLQKRRWFKNGQRWRTGCEGRISVLKRRHGLDRCRYHGMEGMEKWIGWGVLADNLIQMGSCLARQRA